MKREIRFRGKDANSGEWAYGDLIQLDEQLCIAKEDTVISQQTFGGKATEEMKANAQLIATAPELLIELYRTTLSLKALPEIDEEMKERIESAEKIINKALGL